MWQKSKLQIFSFTQTLVIGKSQMKDERHQDGLCWLKHGRFSGLDGGWAVEDILLLGYSCVSFLFFFYSENYVWGKEQTMIPVCSTFKLFKRGNNDLATHLSFFIFICIWLHAIAKAKKTKGTKIVCVCHLQLQNVSHKTLADCVLKSAANRTRVSLSHWQRNRLHVTEEEEVIQPYKGLLCLSCQWSWPAINDLSKARQLYLYSELYTQGNSMYFKNIAHRLQRQRAERKKELKNAQM